ncbi:hypothetical protein [Plasmodium yoelii yoelii]|uniref:Uncharacterized protein n=1 Tax=Plasmodium yoelii yoelii TaxID=73239 RepID=Q7PCZ2_PLAYO|nr:hypothetical protein [Plasmodium yoelii yoelii]EAA22819.1 hypothetical protein [Plasmodium yoelii yoelii]
MINEVSDIGMDLNEIKYLPFGWRKELKKKKHERGYKLN